MAAYRRNGVGGTSAWIKVIPDGPTPAPRKWPEAGYDTATNRMIVFGGALGGSSPCTNEVLVLDNANGVPANPIWIPLAPSGGPPAPRFWHSAVYDPTSNRLTVYGGSNCFTAASFNDVWVLTNANGLGGTPTWIQLSPSGVVAATSRDTHEAVYDPVTNRMIVFGGRNPVGTLNDVRVLTNANGLGGTPAWIELFPTGPLPDPRAVPSGVYDPTSDRFVIFGGGGPSGIKNDVWVLSNASGTEPIPPAWTQLNPTPPLPAERSFPTGVYDSTNNRITIFRGSDGGGQSFNDVWVLTNANGFDRDSDGVNDDLDVCADTVIPESVPTSTRGLGVNRWALEDSDGIFDTVLPRGGGRGPQSSFTIEDTGGCSCEQIIDFMGLGKGHEKFGCSISAMEGFVALVNP